MQKSTSSNTFSGPTSPRITRRVVEKHAPAGAPSSHSSLSTSARSTAQVTSGALGGSSSGAFGSSLTALGPSSSATATAVWEPQSPGAIMPGRKRRTTAGGGPNFPQQRNPAMSKASSRGSMVQQQQHSTTAFGGGSSDMSSPLSPASATASQANFDSAPTSYKQQLQQEQQAHALMPDGSSFSGKSISPQMQNSIKLCSVDGGASQLKQLLVIKRQLLNAQDSERPVLHRNAASLMGTKGRKLYGNNFLMGYSATSKQKGVAYSGDHHSRGGGGGDTGAESPMRMSEGEVSDLLLKITGGIKLSSFVNEENMTPQQIAELRAQDHIKDVFRQRTTNANMAQEQVRLLEKMLAKTSFVPSDNEGEGDGESSEDDDGFEDDDELSDGGSSIEPGKWRRKTATHDDDNNDEQFHDLMDQIHGRESTRKNTIKNNSKIKVRYGRDIHETYDPSFGASAPTSSSTFQKSGGSKKKKLQSQIAQEEAEHQQHLLHQREQAHARDEALIHSLSQDQSNVTDLARLLGKYRGRFIEPPPGFNSSSLFRIMEVLGRGGPELTLGTESLLRIITDPEQKQCRVGTLDGEIARCCFYAEQANMWAAAAVTQVPTYYRGYETVMAGAHDEIVTLRSIVIDEKEEADTAERELHRQQMELEQLRKRKETLQQDIEIKSFVLHDESSALARGRRKSISITNNEEASSSKDDDADSAQQRQGEECSSSSSSSSLFNPSHKMYKTAMTTLRHVLNSTRTNIRNKQHAMQIRKSFVRRVPTNAGTWLQKEDASPHPPTSDEKEKKNKKKAQEHDSSSSEEEVEVVEEVEEQVQVDVDVVEDVEEEYADADDGIIKTRLVQQTRKEKVTETRKTTRKKMVKRKKDEKSKKQKKKVFGFDDDDDLDIITAIDILLFELTPRR